MKKVLKSIFLLLSAGVFASIGKAETYTASNIGIASGNGNGGAYGWAQFKFTDTQNTITNAADEAVATEAVTEYLDIKSVAILLRYNTDAWTATTKVTLGDSTGVALANATSQPLTTEDVTTPTTTKWMVFNFETPVRINKDKIYRITTGSQQYYMTNTSGKAGKNNTTILASGSQDNYSPILRIVADAVDVNDVTRTVTDTDEEKWSDDDWNPNPPSANANVTMEVEGASMLNVDTDASVLKLNINGTGSLTIKGDKVLNVISTSLNVDTTISSDTINLGDVTIAANKTLTVDGGSVTIASMTGAGKLVVKNAGTATITGTGSYTGGTEIAEGATVIISNVNAIGTGNVTGAGTVKIAGGTYNGLSLAQYTDANTTIVIPADNTVTGYFNNATWTCAAKIQLDGTLSLTNGFAAGRYTFTGPWTGAGSFSLSNNNPADAVRITGDISGFTGNISVAGARALTFCAATTGANQKYSGKICVHGDYAYTAKVNGTWSAPVVVENGAKIGGEGSIANTLTFNAGSIIDGAVTATGDVTLPATGTVTVSGEAGATVLTCANAASLDLTKFAAPTGLTCIAEDGAVKLAVAKKTNFVVTVGDETVNCETVAEALEALATNGGSLQIAADADPEALALAETLTITADTTIDFNDKALTSTADPAIHVTGGTLTLTGEGSITAPGVVIQQGTKNAALTTEVVVGEDVCLTSFRTEGEDWDGDNVVLLYGKATLESAGVLLTYSKEYAAIQGSGGDTGADTSITITGGQVVNNGDDVAIYQPQAGTLTIEGGVISGSTAIYAKAGTISISGGEISADGAQCAYGENHNGCGSTGDALVIDETAGYADLSVSITGGAFTSTSAEAVASYAGTGQTAATGIVKAGAATFNTDVSSLCEPGYKTEANAEGIYGVVEDPTYGMVAQVGDTYYATLAEAYAAGSEITLIADVEGPGLVINKNVTIDFGGFAYTFTEGVGSYASNGFQILKGNTVTLKNGTLQIAEAAKETFYTVIQNYADLELVNMFIDGTNTDKWSTTDGDSYALSINSGTVSIGMATTIIANNEGDKAYAFDVCKFASYDAPVVTVAKSANIEGKVELSGGTLKGSDTLTVESGVAGYKAVYDETEGWILEKILTLPKELVDSPAAEAIKAAMQAAKVTEITGYSIITTGSGTPAEVADVAAVLEVFDVTPTVAANGVLSVAYEFGITDIKHIGNGKVAITAGVDEGTAIRAGVTVTFSAGDKTFSTTATGGSEVTIMDIDAATLNGKKISVKATK